MGLFVGMGSILRTLCRGEMNLLEVVVRTELIPRNREPQDVGDELAIQRLGIRRKTAKSQSDATS